MRLPTPDTPLYNHPLPALEEWLKSQGCRQDQQNPSVWYLYTKDWEAELSLDIEDIRVRYVQGGRDLLRAFPYSLARLDVENAIFAGP